MTGPAIRWSTDMRVVIQRRASVGSVAFGLLVVALFFGGSGGALIYLDRKDTPPPLSRLQRDVGRLGGIRLRRYSNVKGAPYLVSTIGGLYYTVDSYRADWLDSIRTTLHTGDTLTVWSGGTPGGTEVATPSEASAPGALAAIMP